MIRMDNENLEDRSVEVLQIPDSLEDDMLWLYFENKRRSGGGNVLSLDRSGDTAILVFESAEGETRMYHSVLSCSLCSLQTKQ